MHAKPGDTVQEGQPLMTLLTDTPEAFDRAMAALEGGYDVVAEGSEVARAAVERPLVMDRIS